MTKPQEERFVRALERIATVMEKRLKRDADIISEAMSLLKKQLILPTSPLPKGFNPFGAKRQRK